MPDIASIGAALGSIKTATDIVKFLRTSDLSIERAELKLKLADLLGALADAKIELVEVQGTLAEKEAHILELQKAFESREMLVRYRDAYYVVEDGKPMGVPFCLRCWENDHKQKQLVSNPKDHRVRVCTSCGHQYDAGTAYEIHPPAPITITA